MKKQLRISLCFATLAGCLLTLAPAVRAQDMVRYHAKPIGSSVTLDGKANIHNWVMKGTIIGGHLDLPASVKLDSTQADIAGVTDGKVPAQVEAGIPVSSLKGDFTGMDEVMMQAMNATDHPRIIYHLTELTFKQPHAAGTPLQFEATGELSFNGVTNKISMPVAIENADNGQFKITTTGVSVNMKDYKVVPPTKLGIFTTEPDVKISFAWTVGQSKSK